MARAFPAAYNKPYSLLSFNCLNPSVIASSVSDEIHNRLTGFVFSAFAKTHRCINSPSIPASPQFTTDVHCSNNVLSVLNCF